MPRGDSAKLTPEQVEAIVHRYVTTLPDGTWEGTTSLAKDFHVSVGVIAYVLAKNNVRRRNSSEAHSNGKRSKPITRLPAGDPPQCKCGCGKLTSWRQSHNRWYAYSSGHYRKPALYKDKTWLISKYIVSGWSRNEIARQCGVGRSTINKFIVKFGIEIQPVNYAKQGSHGAKNGSWKGGISQSPYSANWKSLSRATKQRDNWSCCDCGEIRDYWGNYLHVHHIDGNKLNDDPANLISLCARCHRKRHNS